FAHKALERNGLLVRHQPVPTLLLNRLRHRIAVRVGGSAGDRLVAEAADAIEFGYAEPVEQRREIRFGRARKADDEGRADGEVLALLTPFADALERARLRGWPAHAFEHGSA